ncbi:MAG: hypothetical protein RIM84_10345 [Alphaproteobacteria bacterium]
MSAVERDGPRPLFKENADWDEVQATLASLGLADGLPQVPPTVRRLEAMLAGVAEPERSLGQLPPMFGDLTPAAGAYVCVLAGCLPAELPVVLTAAEACLDPAFNLLGILTTTGTPAVATVVHGPLARELDMNAGTNCLGPGNRANAAIGRAIALAMRIVGGAVEQTGDMATMGQPGKYGFCFAESDLGLLPSLAERRGLDREASAVTVLGVSGTLEVLPLEGRGSPEALLTPVAAAMTAAGAVAGSGRTRPPGEQVVLLPPEILTSLRDHGCSLTDIQQILFEADRVDIPGVATFGRGHAVAATAADIVPIETGGPGVKMTYLPLWAGGTLTQTRAIRDLS